VGIKQNTAHSSLGVARRIEKNPREKPFKYHGLFPAGSAAGGERRAMKKGLSATFGGGKDRGDVKMSVSAETQMGCRRRALEN